MAKDETEADLTREEPKVEGCIPLMQLYTSQITSHAYYTIAAFLGFGGVLISRIIEVGYGTTYYGPSIFLILVTAIVYGGMRSYSRLAYYNRLWSIAASFTGVHGSTRKAKYAEILKDKRCLGIGMSSVIPAVLKYSLDEKEKSEGKERHAMSRFRRSAIDLTMRGKIMDKDLVKAVAETLQG